MKRLFNLVPRIISHTFGRLHTTKPKVVDNDIVNVLMQSPWETMQQGKV